MRVALACCALIACTGDIRTPPPAPATELPACAPAVPQRLVRLSNRHYGNAARDLLGLHAAPVLVKGGGVDDTFFPVDSKSVSFDVALEYQTVAEAAAGAFALNEVGCAGLDERECARATLSRLVPRAFRRPVAPEEIDRLLLVYDVGKDGGTHEEGLRLAVEAVLQSPSFVYRTELSRELDAYEIAVQLSFLLLDSGPDDGLWQAAERGELLDEAGRAAEVRRLLASPAAQANVSQIFLRWFGTARVLNANHDDPAFTPELAASMKRSTELFVDDVLWQQGGSLGVLLTSNALFVDQRLAGHLGVLGPAAGFERIGMPGAERAGLLTQPGLLTRLAGVSTTSVVRRGLFVAAGLLCVQPEPPPPGVVAAAQQALEQLDGERAKAAYRAGQATCGACHGRFDPFGLLLEGYDELGRYRRVLPNGAAVDASGDVAFSTTLRGPMNGAVELSQHLAAGPDVKLCAARRLASYAVGEPLDGELRCLVGDVSALRDGADLDLVGLLSRVAASPHLFTRAEVAP